MKKFIDAEGDEIKEGFYLVKGKVVYVGEIMNEMIVSDYYGSKKLQSNEAKNFVSHTPEWLLENIQEENNRILQRKCNLSKRLNDLEKETIFIKDMVNELGLKKKVSNEYIPLD